MKTLNNLQNGDNRTQMVVFGFLMAAGLVALLVLTHFGVITFHNN